MKIKQQSFDCLPPSGVFDVSSKEIRTKLLANGYEPLPLLVADSAEQGAGKRPIIKDWADVAITADSVASWGSRDSGTGLRTGKPIQTPYGVRYLVALDIDIDDVGGDLGFQQRQHKDAVMDAMRRFLGDMVPLMRVGRPPRLTALYASETPLEAAPDIRFGDPIPDKYRPEVRHVDSISFLLDGRQTVAFGIHPDKFPGIPQRTYSWEYGRSPLTVPLHELPVITQEQVNTFRAHLIQYSQDVGTENPTASGRGSKGGGGGSIVVRDANGKVVDGRDAYLRDIIWRHVNRFRDAAGAPLNANDPTLIAYLTDRAWFEFSCGVASLQRARGVWDKEAASYKIGKTLDGFEDLYQKRLHERIEAAQKIAAATGPDQVEDTRSLIEIRRDMEVAVRAAVDAIDAGGTLERHVDLIKASTGLGKSYIMCDVLLDLFHKETLAKQEQPLIRAQRKAQYVMDKLMDPTLVKPPLYFAPAPLQIIVVVKTHKAGASIERELLGALHRKKVTDPQYTVPRVQHWYAQSSNDEDGNAICVRFEEHEPFREAAQSPLALCMRTRKNEETEEKEQVCACPHAKNCPIGRQLGLGEVDEVRKKQNPDILIITHDLLVQHAVSPYVTIRGRKLIWIDESPIDTAVGAEPQSVSLTRLSNIVPEFAGGIAEWLRPLPNENFDRRISRDILRSFRPFVVRSEYTNRAGEQVESASLSWVAEMKAAKDNCYSELEGRPQVAHHGGYIPPPASELIGDDFAPYKRMTGSQLVKMGTLLKKILAFYGDEDQKMYEPGLWITRVEGPDDAVRIYFKSARFPLANWVKRTFTDKKTNQSVRTNNPIFVTSATPGTEADIKAALQADTVRTIVDIGKLPLVYGIICQIYGGPSSRTRLFEEFARLDGTVKRVEDSTQYLHWGLGDLCKHAGVEFNPDTVVLGTAKAAVGSLHSVFGLDAADEDVQRRTLTIGAQMGLNNNLKDRVFLFVGDSRPADHDVIHMYEILHGRCIDEPDEMPPYTGPIDLRSMNQIARSVSLFAKRQGLLSFDHSKRAPRRIGKRTPNIHVSLHPTIPELTAFAKHFWDDNTNQQLYARMRAENRGPDDWVIALCFTNQVVPNATHSCDWKTFTERARVEHIGVVSPSSEWMFHILSRMYPGKYASADALKMAKSRSISRDAGLVDDNSVDASRAYPDQIDGWIEVQVTHTGKARKRWSSLFVAPEKGDPVAYVREILATPNIEIRLATPNT